MVAFIAKRSVAGVLLLAGAVVVVFALLRLAPGDPAALLLGSEADASQVAALREQLGLDEPIPVQLLEYGKDVATLDFGRSAVTNESVGDMIVQRFPYTFGLAAAAIILAVGIGIPLGVVAAMNRDGKFDSSASTLSLVGQSAPNFWIGIMLLLLLARKLQFFPSSGAATPLHYVLPGFTLAIPLMSVLFRLTRTGVIDALEKQYVDTALSKGLSRQRILWVHVVRNMLIPVVTVAGLQFGQLLGGAVVVETIFTWPGLGRMMVDAINYRDYSVVQGAMIVLTAAFVFANLVVDLLYSIIDPRVRQNV